MKKRISVILSALMLFGCSANEAPKNEAVTVTDSLGRQVEIASFEKTAVLSGSIAEIWQLAGGELYGVTKDAWEGHDLNLPEEVKTFGDVKNPSVEAIISEGVELVILSGSIDAQTELADTFENAGIPAVYLDVESFEDYLDALKICTGITGRADLYEENGEKIKSSVDEIISRTKDKDSPDILLLRAYSTGVKAKGSDNMTGKMLSDLGCKNIADSETSLLEELSLESILRADPDFVFVTTMGEDEEAAKAQYEAYLGSNKAWQESSAVQSGNVYFLPKDMFHYKPNNRWDKAYEYLEEILYGKE